MCRPIEDIPLKEATSFRPCIGKDRATISVEFTVIPLKDIVAMAEMMRDATKKFEECAAQAPAQGWGQGVALKYRDSMYPRVNRGDQPETSQLIEPMIRIRHPRFANALQ
jgi:hypothetical protein